MKSNNLTICIDAKCGKNCPYCISEMTWNPKPNHDLFCKNINKALTTAKMFNVNSVLLTSKGETLNDLIMVNYCLDKFKDFPLEIQTNGILLRKPTFPTKFNDGPNINYPLITGLYENHLNTIAISIDKPSDLILFEDVFHLINRLGMLIRLTVVVTSMWTEEMSTIRPVFFRMLQKNRISQITFRKATKPTLFLRGEQETNSTNKETETRNWIDKNYGKKEKNFIDSIKNLPELKNKNNIVRELPFGIVYTIADIALTIIDYCIQEHHKTDDIRSLIYHHDGHMYTSWDKPASKLF